MLQFDPRRIRPGGRGAISAARARTSRRTGAGSRSAPAFSARKRARPRDQPDRRRPIPDTSRRKRCTPSSCRERIAPRPGAGLYRLEDPSSIGTCSEPGPKRGSLPCRRRRNVHTQTRCPERRSRSGPCCRATRGHVRTRSAKLGPATFMSSPAGTNPETPEPLRTACRPASGGPCACLYRDLIARQRPCQRGAVLGSVDRAQSQRLGGFAASGRGHGASASLRSSSRSRRSRSQRMCYALTLTLVRFSRLSSNLYNTL